MKSVFVEKLPSFAAEANLILADLHASLNIRELKLVRLVNHYQIDGLSEEELQKAGSEILSEPQTDRITSSLDIRTGEHAFAFAYLPGQYDQRADSAAQAIQILTGKAKPTVLSSKIVILSGTLTEAQITAVKNYMINPVDSHQVDLKGHAGTPPTPLPPETPILHSFLTESPAKLRSDLALAMSVADVSHTQDYFKNSEARPPTLTEIRVLDTYWSDHCRHTTFLTAIDKVTFDPDSGLIEETYNLYKKIRKNLGRSAKPITLMDIALIGMRELKASGELDNLEVSEEINAASIVVPVSIDNREPEEWLIQFKNETHNHPTEIEPFGGAATCLGGCIRDPLSGRSYVYQAMRISGAANPLTPFHETLPGKLPQKQICQVAAQGFSSYGNQIGLATGQVAELYHPGYVAKRLEIGAVVAASPRKNVFRGSPAPGDVILLIGGRTGRDGVGGATGSSKEHNETALENSAEVQKGDAPTERKIQRLFRNPELTRKIKVCNDFGAGGISVAIGEIAPSLLIHLDAVPKKYEGLDGTELAISESQERMAVCVHPTEIQYFITEADRENLECVHIADVTDSGRLIMTWRGQEIVNLSREFLNTNGVQQTARVHVAPTQAESPQLAEHPHIKPKLNYITEQLAEINLASQKGLGEMFDASVGANTVLWPFGGKTQLTPPDAMVAKLPLLEGDTDTATFMAWGFDPFLSENSPFLGAAYAVTESVCKAVSAGAKLSDIRLTFQEFFPRLGNDPARWGLPFAALLGAFRAQHELRLAAIGGKDSMSGSFNDLDVPPTLVSFALAPGLASNATSPEFKNTNSSVSILEVPIQKNGLPDFEFLKTHAHAIHQHIVEGKISAIHLTGRAGIEVALTRMALGNEIGFLGNPDFVSRPFSYFSFLIEHQTPISIPHAEPIGETTAEQKLNLFQQSHTLPELKTAWQKTLEPIYPTAPAETVKGSCSTLNSPADQRKTRQIKPRRNLAQPKVLIPTFPGTNSEYDSARAFQRVGASTHIEVFRNLHAQHVEESLKTLAAEIQTSQILFIPGGFSAGDEPDGSAKFIATVLRNSRIQDAIGDLLNNRDGLILGICNGFQALIKTGLATHGTFIEETREIPTLIHNDLPRHISQYVQVRVCENFSPWLSNTQTGAIQTVPVSHGEGKFYASTEALNSLFNNAQVAMRYCDPAGTPTMQHPYNPNGSLAAIEAITSPCGKILGRMAHSERYSTNVAKNIPGLKAPTIFAAGVSYFAQ